MSTSNPAVASGPRWAISDSLIMIGRKLRHVRRTPDELIVSLLLPIIMMLLFVFVFGGAIEVGREYVDYVVPGVIILAAGFSASSTGTGLTGDLVTGVVDRFRTMPITRSSVLTGHVVSSLLTNLVSTGLVVGVALLIGFRPQADVLGWIAAVGVIALYILMICWLSMIFGLLAKTVQGASQFSFAILFLPYLSSGFVPTDSMPSFLRVIAENQPATPVIEAVRALTLGLPVGDNALLAVVWCLGIGLVAFGIATTLFVRRTAR
ncbi:ABC transporter permease [Actinoalloteichus hymeniacidonis]|uniref:Transport permease protein n=1 Tax=Actinoalloteichus hymeniacidonis TaxID=340345 RepID=A0AAC9HPA3_9PSEU|nr:ABC transporter permease [Actinoalloteichus hymeniacidonis]AOS62950.1 ABC-type polysaccharide/polyol phosphate export system, permease component [Actinoalloteichus hymeniacidonis]MBB5909015.1 ABC-2 type transport system permease protein [Actinoalloteichus hymeniacidonis]